MLVSTTCTTTHLIKMKQLSLFPKETFEPGDRVQFIKEGNGVNKPIGTKGTVKTIALSGLSPSQIEHHFSKYVLVKFDGYRFEWYCLPDSVQHTGAKNGPNGTRREQH